MAKVMIGYLDKGNDINLVVSESAALLVYFYSDSCAPCKALRPKVEGLMRERFPKMHLLYVDAAAFPYLAAEHHAFSLPVLLVFFEGKEFRRFSKYVSPAGLESAIERYYDLYFS